MGSFRLTLMVLMVVMVASMQTRGTAARTTHIVGDGLGWTIPSSGAFAYPLWTSFRTFAVGDVLVFNFTEGQDNVAEVPQETYNRCTTNNLISLMPNSPATIPLTTPGKHFYICTFPDHCQNGQKLAINVIAEHTFLPPSGSPIESPLDSRLESP